MTEKFDFEKALEALQAGKPITGKDSVLSPLIKQLTEAALEAEIDTHLAKEISPNRKNGKSRKTMKSSSGSFELETPRDRSSTMRIFSSDENLRRVLRRISLTRLVVFETLIVKLLCFSLNLAGVSLSKWSYLVSR